MRTVIMALGLALVLGGVAGAQSFVGPVDNTFGPGSAYTFYGDGLIFDVLSPMVLTSVNVYPQGAGNIVVNLMDSSLNVLQTATQTVTAAGLTTVVTNFTINPGTGYRLDAQGTTTASGLFRNTGGAVYPYTLPGVVSITGPINALAGYYYFFYNWNVGGTVSPPFWQVNSPEASFDFNGVQVNGPYASSGADAAVFVGSFFNVNLTSNLNPNGHDLLVGTLPTLPAGSGGITTNNGQVFSMNLSDPTAFWLYSAGPLPAFLPYLGPINASLYLPNLANLSAQAVVLNPTHPDGFNLSQASMMHGTTSQVLATITGDDVYQNVQLLSSVTFYGQSFSSIDVSTNGWIKFGANATSSDLAENADNFVNGTMGSGTAAPGIAVIWEDIDMGNRPSSMVQVSQGPGILQIDYIDGDIYPSTPFGNVSCIIDTSGTSGIPVRVTLDYTGYTNAGPPSEGLVGVTDGTTAMSVPTALNFVQGGVVAPYTALNPAETIFQSFDGIGSLVTPIPAEPFDLGGLILTFDDITGFGTFTVY
jgi:hypothetical protein